MSWCEIPRPLVVIVGPTAVGKTEISIQVAERLDAEIVSADSRLFYRGMDIGTAKPSSEERQRVIHHLIDVAEPDEVWSLALYQREAARIIEEIHQRGKLPLLVGGTGQYVRAIIEGWEIPPQAPDHRLRETLERWAKEIGAEELHRKLRLLDPAAAQAIDPRNIRRIIRALEVILGTGKRFSEQRRRGKVPYSLLIVGLKRPRTELYKRIDERIEKMIHEGLVEEVKALLAKGYSPELPPLTAIGYHEIIRYLRGEITLDEAITLMKRRTRDFVRRQATWFREDDPRIHWLEVNEGTVNEILVLVEDKTAWQIYSEERGSALQFQGTEKKG
ncbi:tRNA (adenosine(37)-N6)-dimethylallyltransferase MiaA [Thermanaerothrix sp. 4228-RoL]|uniref:tRNA dimethylallyltransferase n=2 Tax=Thermanaerothrix TaxID=1077886 RepID=A0ABU3NJD9_9CHLR|nr:tRNA (adenosine(37)-N6)-dimethylallyltransferase MiaA [Thermanaerothrix sp. 4228-RoL]MDT8896922.1 tRNA (adenosine(37)-N6)-dimethylallyltransferase MiaA [Thermanaerothrix sp. 4228-RoL]